MEEQITPIETDSSVLKKHSGHEKHCFVVMPYGRDASEIKHFKGWYEVIIKPAVIASGYDPILAAAEEQPGAINDEIRAHLAYDPMVVIDLGGEEAEDDPNPNVMYELGIRHALSLPHVMMAWKGQRLPFDVGNQRVIMEGRDFVDIETNRAKLITFINAAGNGKYYKPMDAVGRLATIEAASISLGEDQIMHALVQEVRDLRTTFAAAAFHRSSFVRYPITQNIKRLLRTKLYRKDLHQYFLSIGGNEKEWPKLLKIVPHQSIIDQSEQWTIDNWKAYIAERKNELIPQDISPIKETPIPENRIEVSFDEKNQDQTDDSDNSLLTEDIISLVQTHLPVQPWPMTIHKQVATKAGISNSLTNRAIHELIRRGIFKEQVKGQIVSCNNPVNANTDVVKPDIS